MRLATMELGPRTGPRIVLVHGFTQTAKSWRAVADALAERFRVVLVDAPGHGGSSDVHADLPRGAELLADVGGSAIYVGYSMGGRLCLHVAVARPELVRGLALLGANPGLEDGDQRASRRAADERWAVLLEHDGIDAFLDKWLTQPLFASLPPQAADLDERRSNTVAGLTSSVRLAGTGAQTPLWDRLSALTMPVLVAAGENDHAYRSVAERTAAAIGRAATVAVVPGAGHAAHLERPDAFLAALRTWLHVAGLDAHVTANPRTRRER